MKMIIKFIYMFYFYALCLHCEQAYLRISTQKHEESSGDGTSYVKTDENHLKYMLHIFSTEFQ